MFTSAARQEVLTAIVSAVTEVAGTPLTLELLERCAPVNDAITHLNRVLFADRLDAGTMRADEPKRSARPAVVGMIRQLSERCASERRGKHRQIQGKRRNDAR